MINSSRPSVGLASYRMSHCVVWRTVFDASEDPVTFVFERLSSPRKWLDAEDDGTKIIKYISNYVTQNCLGS